MGFVKVQKTRAYFKRFQTKFRRRREGKTDYYARKNLIIQDKDKYNSPKYRLVARITNSKIICQVAYATIQGDRILAQATSDELKRFGITAGLTNYAAAYCTGLLLSRRLLKQLGMDTIYAGAKEINGEDYDVTQEQKEDQRRPFKAVLDVGIRRTTTGCRIFGCLKGALDGGLYIPHSVKRFPGFVKEGKDEKYDAKVHRERIFGVHIDNYMKYLKDESQEDYTSQFSQWDACLKKAGATSCEQLYKKAHDAIRKNPERPQKQKQERKQQQYTDQRREVIKTSKGTYTRNRKLNAAERKQRVVKKIQEKLGA